MLALSRTKGVAGYVLSQYIPGTPIHLSFEYGIYFFDCKTLIEQFSFTKFAAKN